MPRRSFKLRKISLNSGYQYAGRERFLDVIVCDRPPVRASQMKPIQMSPITTVATAGSNIIKILDQKSRLFIVMASLPEYSSLRRQNL